MKKFLSLLSKIILIKIILIFIFFITQKRVLSFNFYLTNNFRKQLKIVNQNFSYPPEITPCVFLQKNGQRIYVLTTAWSWLCVSEKNILDSSPENPLIFLPSQCQLITKPDVYDYIDGFTGKTFFKNPQIISPITEMTADWKRNYDGLLSLHLVNNFLIFSYRSAS